MTHVESLLQMLESVFAAMKKDHQLVTTAAIDIFHRSVDMLEDLLAAEDAKVIEGLTPKMNVLRDELAAIIGLAPLESADVTFLSLKGRRQASRADCYSTRYGSAGGRPHPQRRREPPPGAQRPLLARTARSRMPRRTRHHQRWRPWISVLPPWRALRFQRPSWMRICCRLKKCWP